MKYKKKKIFFSLLLLCLILVGFVKKTNAQNQITDPYFFGRIIVKKKVKTYVTNSTLQNNNKSLLLKETPFFLKDNKQDFIGLDRIFIINTVKGKEKQLIDELKKDPNIEYAEPDYLATNINAVPIIPNDFYYKKDSNNNQFWYRNYLPMEYAWNISTGNTNTVIAIIDTGIDFSHPDLINKIWSNPREISGNNIDDDNNGYIDDIHGWNIYQNNNDTEDDYGHGTIVAGVAAASSNNTIGITGMTWNNPILPVKSNIAGNNGYNYSDIAKAIVYADSFPEVKVINLSIGGYSNSSLLADVVKNVLNKNKSVIVAGIGNDNLDIFNKPFYPASLRGVMAVGAYDNGLARVYNFGYPIQVSAPGKNIYTTFLGGDYGYSSGTSIATPFVSGLVALVASSNPDWSERELNQAVKFWADCPPDLPNCETTNWSSEYGYGTISGLMSLTLKCETVSEKTRTTIEIKTPEDKTNYLSQQTVNIEGTVKSNNFSHYVVEYGNGTDPSSWSNVGISLVNGGLQKISNSVISQWDLSKILNSGYYQFRIRTFGDSSCTENLTGDERGMIYVNRRYKITGRITNSLGKGLSQVIVRFKKDGVSAGYVLTGSDGRFNKTNLVGGGYSFYPVPASNEDFFPASRSATFQEGATDAIQQDFTISDGCNDGSGKIQTNKFCILL